MIKRLMSLILVSLCALPLVAVAQTASGTPAAKLDAQVCAAGTASAELADLGALTDQDREAFQQAQRNADPQLGEQRGGFLGLLVVVLLIVLIVVLVD